MKYENEITELVMSKSPLGLVIFNYECILANIRSANAALEASDTAYDKYLSKARSFLILLASSLDMEYEISAELMRLYLYANRLLISSRQKRSKEVNCEACDILSSLLDSWRKLEAEERSQPRSDSDPIYTISDYAFRNGKISGLNLTC